MMPLNYALTDGLVALVAAWGGWRLLRSGRPVAAMGMALFSIAGAIGTVRITLGLGEQLAAAHRFASQVGGVAGVTLFLSQIVREAGWPHPALASAFAAIVAAAVMMLAPGAGAILFVLAIISGTALLWRGNGPESRNIIGALGFAVMLANALLVRKSTWLGADASWHVYHCLVALWLTAFTATLIARPLPAQR